MFLPHPLAPAVTRHAWWRGHRGTPSPRPAVTFWQPLSTFGLLCAALAVTTRVVAPGLLDHASLAIGLAGILLGIPHGAVDHLVPFWAARQHLSMPGLARVLAGYLTVAAVAIVALLLVPTVTLAVFLAASALHFGQAEVEFSAERSPRVTRAPRIDRLRATAHGLTVVALPLALWHDRVQPVLAPLSPALAGRPAQAGFAVIAAGAVLLDLMLLRCDLVAGRRQEAAETVLLVLLMTLVPPLPAFGVYFGAWHALRHTARLLALPGPDGAPLSAGAALRRYTLHALPPTVVVLLALGAVVPTGSHSVLTSALVVLIALTFPHMRTVAALDRDRRAERTRTGAGEVTSVRLRARA